MGGWRHRLRARLRSGRRCCRPARNRRRLSLCRRRDSVRRNLGGRRSVWPRGHLSGGWCDWRNWTLRCFALCGRRRDWSTAHRRRLSLYSRRDNMRCGLCSGRSVRPRRHLSGRRRCDWMGCCRRCHVYRRLSCRGRRCWLPGRWRGSDGRRFCRSGRLLRRFPIRLFLRPSNPILFRLSGLCQHDWRLGTNRGHIVGRSAGRNTGLGRLNQHDTGKNRAGHE